MIVTANSSHGTRTPLEQSLLLLSFFKTTISLIIVIAVAAMASIFIIFMINIVTTAIMVILLESK